MFKTTFVVGKTKNSLRFTVTYGTMLFVEVQTKVRGLLFPEADKWLIIQAVCSAFYLKKLY